MKKTAICLLLMIAVFVGNVIAIAEIDYTEMSLDELLEQQRILSEAIEAAESSAVSDAPEQEDLPELDASGYMELSKGSKGDEVKALQARLFDLGFYAKAIDGDYGNGTVEAIKAFEDYNGLEQTGIATPEFQAVLFSDAAKHKDVPVTLIKFSQADSKSATVLVGGTLDVAEMAIVSPDNATEKGLSFSLDGDEFAEIDENGLLTGKAKGEVTVTATSKEKTDDPKSATLKVKVRQPVESMKLDETSFNVGNGSTRQIEVEVYPEEADDKSVTWSSEAPEIATVSSNGTVKGVDTGTTTITCTANDGSGVMASATVTVITAVKKVAIADKSLTLIEGDVTAVEAAVTPENATDPRISWSSSDTSVATVDESGKVTAKSAGTSVISAEAMDGSDASAEITVYVEPHLPVYVSSIHWQTTWGQKNGKMGVEAESLCTNKTIKSFDYTVVCYNFMGSSATSYLSYDGSLIKAGGTGKSRLTKTTVSGFSSAAKVEITPTKVYFSDGSEATIPSQYRYTSTFVM